MRRILIIAIVAFISPFLVQAQSVFDKETSLGLRFGASTSRLGSNPTIMQNVNYGFIGGLVFRHISESHLGIQLELNYVEAGWSEKLDAPNIYIRHLDYLHFPILTYISLGSGKTNYIINLGPHLSYLISESETVDLAEGELGNEYYGEDLNSIIEFGATFGIGISRKTSMGRFELELRLNQGLSNMFKDTEETPFLSSRNQVLNITFLYLMMIK